MLYAPLPSNRNTYLYQWYSYKNIFFSWQLIHHIIIYYTLLLGRPLYNCYLLNQNLTINHLYPTKNIPSGDCVKSTFTSIQEYFITCIYIINVTYFFYL